MVDLRNSSLSCDFPDLTSWELEVLHEPLRTFRKEKESLSRSLKFPSNTLHIQKAFRLWTRPDDKVNFFLMSATRSPSSRKERGSRGLAHKNSSQDNDPSVALFPSFVRGGGRAGALIYELVERKRRPGTVARLRLDLTRLHLARQRLSSREVNALPHVERLCGAESPYYTYTGRVPHFRRVVQW